MAQTECQGTGPCQGVPGRRWCEERAKQEPGKMVGAVRFELTTF